MPLTIFGASLVTGVAAIGYGGMVASSVVQILPLTQTMMRIAVILVLAGVGCSLLSYLGATAPAVVPHEPERPTTNVL